MNNPGGRQIMLIRFPCRTVIGRATVFHSSRFYGRSAVLYVYRERVREVYVVLMLAREPVSRRAMALWFLTALSRMPGEWLMRYLAGLLFVEVVYIRGSGARLMDHTRSWWLWNAACGLTAFGIAEFFWWLGNFWILLMPRKFFEIMQMWSISGQVYERKLERDRKMC